jgi:DNA-binding winged helix-turn-helix (wHTH) protein
MYRFGACELDVERRELRGGGITTAVEPQVFDVLAYLVGHRDRVVTKEELLDNVWGDRFVSESALTSRIKSARRSVGDSGQSQHVIRTVHGRGYRFAAPVSILAPDARHAGRSWPGAISPFARVPEAHEPTGHPDPAAPGRAWPLLGRVRDLDSIGDAYRAGDYGGVLLTGPAGVGKTRLALDLEGLTADTVETLLPQVLGGPVEGASLLQLASVRRAA